MKGLIQVSIKNSFMSFLNNEHESQMDLLFVKYEINFCQKKGIFLAVTIFVNVCKSNGCLRYIVT